ncbi:unnamed protein product [Leptosia nina]|uniref:Uncharacterized protein n=1 Tax=Leptosia nina TaxID=320188 RepID=A0AAV1JAP5_9NEOP
MDESERDGRCSVMLPDTMEACTPPTQLEPVDLSLKRPSTPRRRTRSSCNTYPASSHTNKREQTTNVIESSRNAKYKDVPDLRKTRILKASINRHKPYGESPHTSLELSTNKTAFLPPLPFPLPTHKPNLGPSEFKNFLNTALQTALTDSLARSMQTFTKTVLEGEDAKDKRRLHKCDVAGCQKVKSPTAAVGRAAGGASPDQTSSRDIHANTQDIDLSHAPFVSALLHAPTTWGCICGDTDYAQSNERTTTKQ